MSEIRPPAHLATHVMIWNRGLHALHAGQLHAACAAFEQVSVEDPLNVAAKVQLAVVLLQMRRFRESHAVAMQAWRLRPRTAEHVVPLARLLRNFEEAQPLQEIFEAGEWREWRSVGALFALARNLSTVGLNDEARSLLDAALAIDPDDLHCTYLSGAIAMFQGREEDAGRSMYRSLEIAPHLAQADWMLSLLEKRRSSSDAIARLRSALSASDVPPRDFIYLNYALHNRLHTQHRYDEAWDALVQAWGAKRRTLRYDAGRQARLLDEIKRVCTAGFIAHGAKPDAPTGAAHARVIFIVGLHRSGTSLLERMLGGHQAISEGGESYAFSTCLKLAADHASRELVDELLVQRSPGVDYGEVADRFGALMDWRAQGRPYVTEKLPGNFLLAGFILRAMPDAVVLHMVRDPVDTCFSNLRTYFEEAAPYSHDQADMAHYYHLYRDLMSHWHAVAPGRVLDVDYASLVSQPESTIRGVLDHCGLEFESGVLHVERAGGSVRTASMMDARLGIRKDRHTAWAAYASHLGPLLEGLQAVR